MSRTRPANDRPVRESGDYVLYWILWVLGRYDRPWGPERPIYDLVRYMTSASAVRKLHMKEYLARYVSG